MKIVSLFYLLVLLLSAESRAGTYHVAVHGSDRNEGTSDHPFKSIQAAIDKSEAGDTILIAGGLYMEPLNIKNKKGSPGRSITVKNLDAKTPVIDGANLEVGDWTPLVHVLNSEYIRLEGLEIRNSPGYNVLVQESRHVELINLDVHGSRRNGGIVLLDKGRPDAPAFNVVSGCKSHDNFRGGICLEYSVAGYYLIENNEVYSNQGHGNYDGIQMGSGSGGCHHVVVRGNRVYDNGNTQDCMDQIDVGGHGENHHFLIEGNDAYCRADRPGGAVKIHGAPCESGNPTARYGIIRRNRLTHVGMAFYETPSPYVWYHNTVVGKCMLLYMGGGKGAAAHPKNPDGGYNYGDETFTGGDCGRLNFKNNLFYQLPPDGKGDLRPYLMQFSNGTEQSPSLQYSSVRFQNNLYHFSLVGRMIWRSNDGVGWNQFGKEMVLGGPMTPEQFARYQNSNKPHLPDVGSILTDIEPGKMFVNAAQRDYRPIKGSPSIDRGMPLTRTTGSGVKSTLIQVDRASYFQDGYLAHGETLVQPDRIQVGVNVPVEIVPGGVDDVNNTIRIKQEISWNEGDPVSLPSAGSAPDIGAHEFDEK